MGAHTSGLYHLFKRMKLHHKKRKYSASERFKHFYDFLVYSLVFIIPIINLPQLFEIGINKSAEGVSYISWIGFSIISVIWMGYGLLHKEKPIIYTNLILIFMQLFIAVGAIIYG